MSTALLACMFATVVAQPLRDATDPLAERAETMTTYEDAATPVSKPFTFVKRFHVPYDERKFLIQQFIAGQNVIGWTGGVINWRYNDAGRNPAICGANTAAQALATIQAAQAKWSSVCNVTFNYLGTTSAASNIAIGGASDNVNTIGWSVQAGNQTGITGISGTGSSSAGPFTIIESDIALNSAFNPVLDVTAVHEVGHMLGIDHSNVQGTVMSGPNPPPRPSTAYTSLSSLTADDIAGCQALYGPPAIGSGIAITGTITNGGSAVSGITFCANTLSGTAPTCMVMNACSGAYSCAVPTSGWSGSIHPRASGARIPAQVFANVTASVVRNIAAQSNSSFPACNLDIDNNGLLEPAIDGVAILRYLSGVNQAALPALAGACAQSSGAANNYTSTNSFGFNATGGGAALAVTDGAIIVRAMSGAGAASENNLLKGSAVRTSWTSIQQYLNSTCGTGF